MTNKPQKITTKRIAVLTYDGRDWSAFFFGRKQISQSKEAGNPATIPVGILKFLSEHQTKVVRLLLDGEVRKLDTSLPSKLSFSETSAMLAHEVAEQSGVDGVDLICAGGSGHLFGTLDPCLLTGAFDRRQVDGLRQQLEQAGLQFDGIGSLELACASYWNQYHDRDTRSLILFGRDQGFALPARSLPDNPGPLSLSGGMRQIQRDPQAWQTRFIRGNRYLMNAESLAIYALGSDIDELATALEGIDELATPVYPELEDLLEKAARQAAIGQANQFDSPVPIRNPNVLRKRFSHAFIIAPCLLILMLPFLVFGLAKLNLYLAKKEYQEVVSEFEPLEKRIEEAERKKQQTQARYDNAISLQQLLADHRKPLFAFIHLSYFFSKHAGNSVRLESLSDNGGVIEIRGIYTDPEDGLSLKDELNEFATDKNLRIVHNRVGENQNAEGRVFLELELGVDYQELSK